MNERLSNPFEQQKIKHGLISYYKIEQRWTKENRDEQKSKLKTKYMRMNISSFLLFKSKPMVWIYTSSTLILGLTKEEKN